MLAAQPEDDSMAKLSIASHFFSELCGAD